MLDPTIIVAIISSASLIFTTFTKVASDHLGKCKNEDNAKETALSAQSGTAVSSPKVRELNETLQSLDRRMDRKEMEFKSLQKRVKTIHAEGLELDRRADEAISTYGTSVHLTMLFHGLGSIFLQLNYPYIGTSVSVLMVVSFFSTFAVAYIVSFNTIEKLSQWEKDLQRRQRELQNDIACFGVEIKRTYSDEELKTFVIIGALGEVLNWIGSLNRDAGALQSTITGLLEISSNSESSRSKSLFQVAACAIICGLSFPMMAYYLLSWLFSGNRFLWIVLGGYIATLGCRLGFWKVMKIQRRRWIPDTKSLWRMGNSKSVKRNNHEIVVAQPAESKTADGTLQLIEGRMDRMDVVVQSLQRKINTLYAEQLHFEKSADETISTYASNVQLIMLFHGLGSVFLQVNFPYAGAGVSFVMVVSFFSAFMVAYIVTLNNIEKMSEFEKNLQRRQMDLQNEVTCFGAKMEAPFSSGELENLARRGALAGVLESMGSLRRGADALQKDISKILELSNSKNIRMKSLSQVAVGAIIYGLCFPTIAYYFLCLVGFRRAGTMQQY